MWPLRLSVNNYNIFKLGNTACLLTCYGVCWVGRYNVSGQRLWDRLHWPCSVHSSVYAAPWHSLAVPCSSLAPAYDDDNALSVRRGNAHIWGRAPEGVMDAPSNGRQQPARLLRQIGQPPAPSTRRLLAPWRCLIASWPLQRLTDMQACVRVSINGNDYFHRFSWQLPPGSFQSFSADADYRMGEGAARVWPI